MKKSITFLMIFALLFQSCKVYDSKTASKQDALLSEGRVKVKSTTKETYKFEKLIEEENQLYGIAKRQSSKSKQVYNDNIVNDNKLDKNVKILLTDDLVNEIHLFSKGKTKALGTTMKVLGVGYVLVLIVGAAAVVALLLAMGGSSSR
ncbi:MAG: hypothetical protein DA407_11490 [Bacteroidetes bacterium]|nr:MAG: hypothetical protein DA407_11490 [Bacteroidota bacterium]